MYTRNCTDAMGQPRSSTERSLFALIHSATRYIRSFQAIYGDWRRRLRLRRYLAQMTDHELLDIGISRGEAERESSLPFWRRMEIGRHRT